MANRLLTYGENVIEGIYFYPETADGGGGGGTVGQSVRSRYEREREREGGSKMVASIHSHTQKGFIILGFLMFYVIKTLRLK